MKLDLRISVVLLAGLAAGSALVPATGTTQSQLAPVSYAVSAETKEILDHMSIVYLDDGTGGTVKTVDISGINVRITNGLGATNGYPADPDSTDDTLTATNGLGNLIIGYNELRGLSSDDRTGSHNIAFGRGNSFSGFGGLVGPRDNAISGAFASVSGGAYNTAVGGYYSASVSGGHFNEASGGSSVSGGAGNTANGYHCSISGGFSGTASGGGCSISGGEYNTASGVSCSISGGWRNVVSGGYCSISGGGENTASGTGSTISGGQANTADLLFSSVSGGLSNAANADWSAVSGGWGNTANHWNSTVGGGCFRTVSGECDWRAGTLFEND